MALPDGVDPADAYDRDAPIEGQAGGGSRPDASESDDAQVAWPGAFEPLGVNLDDDGAQVALWSQGAEAVEFVRVRPDGEQQVWELPESTFHVFHGYIPGIEAGDEYGFRVHGPWDPNQGQRFNPAKLLLDPYARAMHGELQLHSAIFGHHWTDDTHRNDEDSAPYVPHSVAVRSEFDWQGVRPPTIAWGDTIIYEAHVKGFTQRNPRIPQELRGTYAGLGHPASIEHLVNLGVTSVELLPVHHFVDETHLLDRGLRNYWGYNSMGYFAPHAAYSASGTHGQQVDEFKAMVKALHAAGLEVILDVVYNHTAEGNQLGPTLGFRGIDNAAYYRLAEDKRFYADYTGCGNTLNAAQPHVLRMIMDSLRYWVEEMHVDGFRFDLASALARSFHDVDMLGSFMTTIAQDPVLRRVKLIAEPWDVGDGGYQVGEFPPLWTEWNDRFRDTLRDFWRDAAGVAELGWRLSGSADVYSSQGRRPFASINFVTAHDGFTLRDTVSYDHKHNEANGEDNRDGTDNNRSWNTGIEGETDDEWVNSIRRRRLRSQLTTLLLSTGVPMVTAGDEFGRTQRGNNNAYCQDNEISWLDWEFEPWQQDLLDYATAVVQLRRRHRVFRQRYFFAGRPVQSGGVEDLVWFGTDGNVLSQEAWNDPGTRTLAMYLSGMLKARNPEGIAMRDDPFLLLLNGGLEDAWFTLPGEPYASAYEVLLDGNHDQLASPRTVLAGDQVHVMGLGAVVLLAR